MIPIALASVVVLAFTIERMIGLRRKKMLPPQLLSKLQSVQAGGKDVSPRETYRSCQQHPSPLARVVRAGVLKVGRPHAEVEKAVEDALVREEADLSNNIRPINVSASVSPLIGLLGTVQGMILAFMVTSTTSATGAAKAQELAHGIYTALVTTFAGLCVAIIGILCAHFLEGRIDRLLREMEDLLLAILPQFERYEGRTRVSRKSSSRKGTATTATKDEAAEIEEPTGSAQTEDRASADRDDLDDEQDESDVSDTAAPLTGLWSVMQRKGERAETDVSQGDFLDSDGTAELSEDEGDGAGGAVTRPAASPGHTQVGTR